MPPPNETASQPESLPATISIYQNADHVAGILQQLVDQGLLVSEESEHGSNEGEHSTTAGDARAGVTGDVRLLGVGGITATTGAGGQLGTGSNRSRAALLRKRVEYSQAYYLHLLRRRLNDRGRVTRLSQRSDAEGLAVGTFVEFEATFRADEAAAILDVATPEFVSAVVDYLERQKTINGYDAALESAQTIPQYLEKRQLARETRTDLARAVAHAIRVDFRSEATRQYYGEINAGDDLLHVITICEADHFITSDQDRLLDGRFTVLGKVVATGLEDAAILAPNKLLSRLNPDLLDELLGEMQEKTGAAGAQLTSAGSSRSVAPGDVFDTQFRAKLDGTAIKVLPIAIYV